MDVERLQEALKDFEKRGKKEACPVLDQFLSPEPRGILKIVTGFNGIPFTIQRLCELLTDPRRNYTGTDKFLRGVEKNVMVVSCVYPSSEKNNSNSLNRMNGVMFPGNSPSYTDRSNINGPGTPRPLNRPKWFMYRFFVFFKFRIKVLNWNIIIIILRTFQDYHL
uniref:Uncharacterized protein n=1 Tax=Sciurus vulgaris TaxID=55149 RepID=A0A8D2D0J9_SCIVU